MLPALLLAFGAGALAVGAVRARRTKPLIELQLPTAAERPSGAVDVQEGDTVLFSFRNLDTLKTIRGQGLVVGVPGGGVALFTALMVAPNLAPDFPAGGFFQFGPEHVLSVHRA